MLARALAAALAGGITWATSPDTRGPVPMRGSASEQPSVVPLVAG